MPCKIIRCECRSSFQDSQYGEGMRVFNQTMMNDKKTFRCTVCTKEKSIGEPADTKGKKK